MNMYRYTLKLSAPEGKLDERAIKAAVDQRLLFAHRPVTFRFGKMAHADSTLLMELATELPRAPLLDLLRPLEAELGIRLESAGWGWIVSDAAPGNVQTAQASDPTHEPYAFVQPQQALEQVYRYNKRQLLRLTISVPVSLFVVFIVIFGVLLDTPMREWIRARDYVWIGFWLPFYVVTTAFQIQLYPLVFVSTIRCDGDGIEIKYWFRRPMRMLWRDATELVTTFEHATLRSPGQVLKFPVGQALGLTQTPTVIKTIAVRASLHYIGYIPRKGAVYKRYDAE